MGDSDFLEPFIIDVRRLAFSMRTCHLSAGRFQDLPVPEQGISAHAGFYDHAGLQALLQ